MDLEKIATSAIVSSISKTDTLSGFIRLCPKSTRPALANEKL